MQVHIHVDIIENLDYNIASKLDQFQQKNLLTPSAYSRVSERHFMTFTVCINYFLSEEEVKLMTRMWGYSLTLACIRYRNWEQFWTYWIFFFTSGYHSYYAPNSKTNNVIPMKMKTLFQNSSHYLWQNIFFKSFVII